MKWQFNVPNGTTSISLNAEIICNSPQMEQIKVTGKKNMNLPITPCQNANGINGAKVVSVPDNTGTNTSPAASLAAFFMGTFPLSNIR